MTCTIRVADNGWIITAWDDESLEVRTTVHTEADDALWEVAECLDMPTERHDALGRREVLILHYAGVDDAASQ